jgi:hypothetical protein
VLLAVAKITALDEVLELARPETSGRVRELEGPQEVADLLEIRANGEDLMDDVLYADDPVLAQVLLDDGVVGESNSLLVAARRSVSCSNIGNMLVNCLHLAVSSLVDEFTNRLEVWISVSNVRLNNTKHLDRSLGKADEDSAVDLDQAEKL